MKEQVYVDRLFADYDDNCEIRDFKEEIVGNLKERIKELMSKGLDEEKAFDKATAELGDITAIADDVGRKKSNDTIGEMYMRIKVPLTKKTAAGLAVGSGLLLFSMGWAFVTFFGETSDARHYYISVVVLSIACGLYTYVGLTQETTSHYPMKSGRAFVYGTTCLIGFLCAGVAVVTFLFYGFEMSAALGISMVLMLPAICVFIFLLATESDRQKPWLKNMIEREIGNFECDIVDPVASAKFGVASGGLWILAIAIFATLTFIFGWQYSWLIILFTLVIQVFMTMMIFEKQ